jgi:hypothetical protein
MGADERDVDAAGDQRFERRVGRWLGEAVNPPALQVRDPRRELEPEQGTESEDVIGITTAIGVVAVSGTTSPNRWVSRKSLIWDQAGEASGLPFSTT